MSAPVLNSFFDLLAYITYYLPDFLLAEPIVYFVTTGLALLVLGLLFELVRTRF